MQGRALSATDPSGFDGTSEETKNYVLPVDVNGIETVTVTASRVSNNSPGIAMNLGTGGTSGDGGEGRGRGDRDSSPPKGKDPNRCTSGSSPQNNPELHRNVASGATVMGVVFTLLGVAVINVVGFPEAEAAEATETAATWLRFQDGLAGEPFGRYWLGAKVGAANGALIGGALGYAVTEPMPPDGCT